MAETLFNGTVLALLLARLWLGIDGGAAAFRPSPLQAGC
jgi:hypothetical protein